MQTEPNIVDEYWVDNLWIFIVFFKLDSVSIYLFQFGEDFFFGQVFQDLHFVDFENFSEELLGYGSTILCICVFVGVWIKFKALFVLLFWNLFGY